MVRLVLLIVGIGLSACGPRPEVQLEAPREDLAEQSLVRKPVAPESLRVERSSVPRHLRAPESAEVMMRLEDVPRGVRVQ